MLQTLLLLRALQERRLLDTDRGKIAIGWLIVEDIAMVLAIVLLPVFAASATAAELASQVGITLRFVGCVLPEQAAKEEDAGLLLARLAGELS